MREETNGELTLSSHTTHTLHITHIFYTNQTQITHTVEDLIGIVLLAIINTSS